MRYLIYTCVRPASIKKTDNWKTYDYNGAILNSNNVYILLLSLFFFFLKNDKLIFAISYTFFNRISTGTYDICI